MSIKERRERLISIMENNSLAIIYSGKEISTNGDEYYPFEVNSNFYYLTNFDRAGIILVLGKFEGRTIEKLFTQEKNEFFERWTGKIPSIEEVKQITQIEDVSFVGDFNSAISRIMSNYPIETVYFDCFRNDIEDMPSYNELKAEEFKNIYKNINVKNIYPLLIAQRECKDDEEIDRTRKAVELTRKGLEKVLENLKPGMKEYQMQSIFEGSCKFNGAEKLAFPTISAGGINACSMHYVENKEDLKDGELLLMDLGAKYGNYCSDITRTYPVNGKFSKRQKEIYELVLKANKEVAKKAAPGVSFKDIEELTCRILGEGLVSLGLIKDVSEVRKYYMHSVSHSIGIDAHDASRRDGVFKEGFIISDEPGLYIDEEGIGIRIEDDLLITKDGCEVLSKDIPKEIDEIESLMK